MIRVDVEWSIKRNAPWFIVLVLNPCVFFVFLTLMHERKKQVTLLLSIKSLKEIGQFTSTWLKIALYYEYISHPFVLILLISLMMSEVSFDYVALTTYLYSSLGNLVEVISGFTLFLKLNQTLHNFIVANEKLILDCNGQTEKLMNENRRVTGFIKMLKINIIQTGICSIVCIVYVIVGMPQQYLLNNSLYILVGATYFQKELAYLKALRAVKVTARLSKVFHVNRVQD